PMTKLRSRLRRLSRPSSTALLCQLLDPVRRPRKRLALEEERHRIADRVERRPVQLVRFRRRVQRVADRDLVADDELALGAVLEQPPEPLGVPPCRVVQALAARERLLAPQLRLELPVARDLPTLQVAEVDVVEERLDPMRDISPLHRQRARLPRPREPRAHPEVEVNVCELRTE